MVRASTKLKKKAYLEALEKSMGVQTTAMKAAGIATRKTIKDWRESDPEFAKAIEDISDVALDFAESALYKQIQKGDTTATIFYLKTKGKNRGYVERFEQTGKDGKDLMPKYEVEIIDNRTQVIAKDNIEDEG